MDRPVYTWESMKDIWKGCPVLIMGRGYSRLGITPDDIDAFRAKGGKLFIVNELLLEKEISDRADVLCFLDNTSILSHFEELMHYPKPIWTLSRHVDIAKSIGPMSHEPNGEQGPWFVPGTLYQANSSTYFALQIAYQAGCHNMWLAGIDLRLCPDDKTHADKQQWCMREQLIRQGSECLRSPSTLDRPTNDYHSRLVLQFGCYASLRVYADAHPDDIEVYKTSDWSLLPFATKELPI